MDDRIARLSHDTMVKISRIAADLEDVAEKSKSGTTNHNLRHLSSRLREFSAGHLEAAWREAQFGRQLHIEARAIDKRQLRSDQKLIVGGAVDHDRRIPVDAINAVAQTGTMPPAKPANPSAVHVPIKIIARNEKGEEIEVGQQRAVAFAISGPESFAKYLDGGNSVPGYVPVKPIPAGKYFQSPVIYDKGQLITREDIIQFVAIYLLGVHYKPNKADKTATSYLKKLVNTNIMSRNQVFYQFMTIAQEISEAPDIKAFIEFSKQLPQMDE